MTPRVLPDTPQFFDPLAERIVTNGRLPHWAQAGVVTFITFRTWDSIPRAVLEGFLAARNEWLLANGIDPDRPDWEGRLRQIPASAQNGFKRFWFDHWEGDLDGCHGTCPLRRPSNAAVVADALRHFDGERYRLTDFVVMPNHVHVLAVFAGPEAMRARCESWKHFTARQLNRLLGRSGRFWQEDSFDHLIRSAEQFDYYRDYVADNPRRARLRAGEFAHYSTDLLLSPRRVAVTGPLAERADDSPEANP